MDWSRILAPILAVCMIGSAFIGCRANSGNVTSDSDAAVTSATDRGVYTDTSNDAATADNQVDAVDAAQQEDADAVDEQDGSWLQNLLPAACAGDDEDADTVTDENIQDGSADAAANENADESEQQTSGSDIFGWLSSCRSSDDEVILEDAAQEAEGNAAQSADSDGSDTQNSDELTGDGGISSAISYIKDIVLCWVRLPEKLAVSDSVSGSDVSGSDVQQGVSPSDAVGAVAGLSDLLGNPVDAGADTDAQSSEPETDTQTSEPGDDPENVLGDSFSENEPAADDTEQAPEPVAPVDPDAFPALSVVSAATLDDGEGTVMYIGDIENRGDLVVTVMSPITKNVVVILNSKYSEGHDPDVKAIIKHFSGANNVYIYRQDISFFIRLNEEAECELFHSNGTPYDGAVYIDSAVTRPAWLDNASLSMLGSSDIEKLQAQLAADREASFSPYLVEAYNIDVYRYFAGFRKK